LSLADIAQEAHAKSSELAATCYFLPETVTWSNGVHAVVVRLDHETGALTILRYVVVHDCGTVINPMIVDGQVHGGVAQGIAGALLEEVTYDQNGQCLNATLMDYLVPTAHEIPTISLEHMETPSLLNPLGIKGVGEGGAIPGAAVLANAVEDALRRQEAVVRATPLSPSYVWSLLNRSAHAG
jgi:aerobic carbon-monoxide dehydrogenase large subunit